MIFSDLCLWHIWSMYWNFHVTEIISSQENWILVIFWCNQKSGGNRKILPVTIVKPLTFNNTGVLNGLKIQKIISVTKSVNRKNCGWQFSKLCVFLIVNRKNLTKNNFFSWFRKNVGEYSNHKNLRSIKQFFSEITWFCYKWHVSRWNIVFDYAL